MRSDLSVPEVFERRSKGEPARGEKCILAGLRSRCEEAKLVERKAGTVSPEQADPRKIDAQRADPVVQRPLEPPFERIPREEKGEHQTAHQGGCQQDAR
jgi:hypothetical protein